MIVTAIMSTFYLFVITAFVANAIIRDDVSGFAPMVRATPVTKYEMLYGRFIGALLVAIVGYLAFAEVQSWNAIVAFVLILGGVWLAQRSAGPAAG